ncbi:DUF541 domain-containing protein [Candidatus Saccharibacteria bacterium]|nr:MAG: DUF541 domain-containing protein [Candidatus Saccharibacteria bacterium]
MSSTEPVVLPPVNAGGSGGKNKVSLSVDLRLVIIALLVIIVAMVAFWKPWQSKSGADARTISVTGQATVKATPDEFVFSPSYQFKNSDKDTALKALAAKSDVIVSELKKLGVPEKGIKTNSNGYQTSVDPYAGGASRGNDDTTYVLNVVVTLNDEKLVQKVQDYLVTTTPEGGSVSPYATFSTTKQKQLEAQARDQATKEARSKADQSAKNLGFKVGDVKNIDDSGFGGGVMPYAANSTMGMAEDTKSAPPSLAVQPGENDLNYSVTVVYYIR